MVDSRLFKTSEIWVKLGMPKVHTLRCPHVAAQRPHAPLTTKLMTVVSCASGQPRKGHVDSAAVDLQISPERQPFIPGHQQPWSMDHRPSTSPTKEKSPSLK